MRFSMTYRTHLITQKPGLNYDLVRCWRRAQVYAAIRSIERIAYVKLL